jgi:hypothetical protein
LSRLGSGLCLGCDEPHRSRSYLSKLCESLRNSMIDHSSLHARLLQAATGTVESSQAVSLGFVTTELVINALKHAFPPRVPGWRSSRDTMSTAPVGDCRYPTTALGVTTPKQAAAWA